MIFSLSRARHTSLFDPLQQSFSEPEQNLNHRLLCVSGSGLDPSQRQGVEELISAAPSRFDHAALFAILQRSTLQHRMNDSFSCLVRRRQHSSRHDRGFQSVRSVTALLKLFTHHS